MALPIHSKRYGVRSDDNENREGEGAVGRGVDNDEPSKPQ